MATRTTYYNLIKPSQTDLVDVRDLNTNFDNIDAIMHTNEVNIDALDGRITTAESDIEDLEEATEHLSDGEVTYPYASEIEIEDALGVNAKNVSVKITAVQSGSGTPSPQNVRPISGWDECKIDRVGKNLLPMTVASIKALNTNGTWSGNAYTLNGVTFTVLTDVDGNVTGINANGLASATTLLKISDFSFPIGSYIKTGCPSGGSTSNYWFGGSSGNQYGSELAFTVSDSSTVYNAIIAIANGYTANNLVFYPMIRLATETDATFEPYKGKTYIIQLGDTIYGGTIDATTGVMKVTHAFVTLNSSHITNASVNSITDTLGGKRVNTNITGVKYTQNTPTVISNALQWNNDVYLTTEPWTVGVADDGHIVIRVAGATTANEAKAYLANNTIELCYELATPMTIQLTPQQIKLLEGYNLISANTGDIQVTTTDIKGAIGQADELIEANTQAIREIDSFNDSIFGTVETGTTASKAYAQGDYFVKDKKMCKALTSIAQGATFTLNTNYASYTIAEILKAIETL